MPTHGPKSKQRQWEVGGLESGGLAFKGNPPNARLPKPPQDQHMAGLFDVPTHGPKKEQQEVGGQESDGLTFKGDPPAARLPADGAKSPSLHWTTHPVSAVDMGAHQ